ncbi:epithelial splicing regulatory protein 1-like isoform X1 [Dreissena polymorpha]|uniref:epithelial splicing regulatory protein 1-like isoform X1 n=1 Tax=Dreissena polymorpha TaxID=45954 RepID=UPI0022640345|nr:epithelial splicing regulatory protein 1-like isoform X1 [Dreissena polymorpha]
MRGLPGKATHKDIRNFFSPICICGVDYNRREKSGRAIVTFSSKEEAAEALNNNLKIMDGRYITLTPCATDMQDVEEDSFAPVTTSTPCANTLATSSTPEKLKAVQKNAIEKIKEQVDVLTFSTEAMHRQFLLPV